MRYIIILNSFFSFDFCFGAFFFHGRLVCVVANLFVCWVAHLIRLSMSNIIFVCHFAPQIISAFVFLFLVKSELLSKSETTHVEIDGTPDRCKMETSKPKSKLKQINQHSHMNSSQRMNIEQSVVSDVFFVPIVFYLLRFAVFTVFCCTFALHLWKWRKNASWKTAAHQNDDDNIAANASIINETQFLSFCLFVVNLLF